MKRCSRCGDVKHLSEFYTNANGVDGVMPYCKRCDNTRPRKPSQKRITKHRARHRAVADLIAFHTEEFEALYAIRMAEAAEEAAVLTEERRALAEAEGHEHVEEPVRLRPGPRMEGETVVDRIDVARCSECVKYHDAGHVCQRCGTKPTVPSGMRDKTTRVDAARLAEFNAGTKRAGSG